MKGQKISERYQIIKNIGEGGMANVYLAYDTILDREVAVKVLRGDLATDDKFVRRFQREALAASSLNNPNIVEVYDVGEDDGDYYIVMEYVEGKHLKQLIKKRGKLTISEVVDIALQITNGLSVAHDSYLIHRDIKPQNILILDNGLVKITDFGISVAMNATQLTQTNSVMGSVHYLPPEQAMGKSSSLQSDIYSIGILIYELLAGKLPFTGDNAVEIALKHLKENIPDISDSVNVPQSIANIIIKSTSKNPKNRYADAREMNEDLKTCLEENRIDEPKIVLKHPETDYDETKVMKMVQKEEKKEDSKDDVVIAKKVSGDNKTQNKFLIILGSIFTGLIVIVTTLVLFIPSLASSDVIKIPEVSGLSITKAIETLQDAGFTVSDEEIEQSSKDIEEGNVIKTSPAEGSERKKGSSVTLYVSIGNTLLTIEDYVGQKADTVQGSLTTLGLQVTIEYKKVDLTEKEYESGIIIEQSVEPETELSEGDKIILFVPKIDGIYPDFLAEGMDIDDVKDFAEEYGLVLTIEEVETTEYEEGAVYYQSRNAGDDAVANTPLKVRVAVAPAGTTNPIPDPDTNPDEDNCVAEDGSNLC